MMASEIIVSLRLVTLCEDFVAWGMSVSPCGLDLASEDHGYIITTICYASDLAAHSASLRRREGSRICPGPHSRAGLPPAMATCQG